MINATIFRPPSETFAACSRRAMERSGELANRISDLVYMRVGRWLPPVFSLVGRVIVKLITFVLCAVSFPIVWLVVKIVSMSGIFSGYDSISIQAPEKLSPIGALSPSRLPLVSYSPSLTDQRVVLSRLEAFPEDLWVPISELLGLQDAQNLRACSRTCSLRLSSGIMRLYSGWAIDAYNQLGIKSSLSSFSALELERLSFFAVFIHLHTEVVLPILHELESTSQGQAILHELQSTREGQAIRRNNPLLDDILQNLGAKIAWFRPHLKKRWLKETKHTFNFVEIVGTLRCSYDLKKIENVVDKLLCIDADQRVGGNFDSGWTLPYIGQRVAAGEFLCAVDSIFKALFEKCCIDNVQAIATQWAKKHPNQFSVIVGSFLKHFIRFEASHIGDVQALKNQAQSRLDQLSEHFIVRVERALYDTIDPENKSALRKEISKEVENARKP